MVLLIKLYNFETKINNFNEIVKMCTWSEYNGNEKSDEDIGMLKTNVFEEDSDGGKCSPYYKDFLVIEETVSNQIILSKIKRDFCSSEFINYISEFLMPCFGLWSAVSIHKLSMNRDSNAQKISSK